MATTAELDRAFHLVLQTFVEQGTAPHYTDLARQTGRTPEAGRALLHDLLASGIPAWLHPSTELIASFAPFNAVPTHYRIGVDGKPRGYAQCGFEVLALSWVFPGRTVRVDAPCLDCGEPLHLAMRDGKLLETEPPGLVGYVSLPIKAWRDDLAYA